MAREQWTCYRAIFVAVSVHNILRTPCGHLGAEAVQKYDEYYNACVLRDIDSSTPHPCVGLA